MDETKPFTPDELVKGLTEWHRRWIFDPNAFWSEASMEAADPSTYGGLAGPYLVRIMVEQRQAKLAEEAPVG